ncbi:leukocyte surface antigen CD53-like [Epargyreus clarus]|uniref:leukocyte surface antigen CD53-like n=1 Tax=Epargyreus clarus TaxID=520877 RepID=UPI003C2FA58B
MCICLTQTVKYVLFLANLLFCLAGLTLIGLGIAVIVQLADIEILQETAIRAIPISVIVLGGVIFLIAFFGCCGAIRQSKCFLLMYSIILMLLAAGKLYLAVVLFQGLSNVYELVEDWIGVAFNNNSMREAFHFMEATFRCCGTTGPDAYLGILPDLPWSCCATPAPDNTCSRIDAYLGCNGRISGYFESFGGAIGGVIIAVIAFEILAVVLGLVLCCSIENKRRKTV